MAKRSAKTTAKNKTAKTKTRAKKFDDYEVTETTVEAPKGFSKAVNPSAVFFKFENVGDECRGIYQGTEKSTKKNFADSILIEQADGSVCKVPMTHNLELIFNSGKNKFKAGQEMLIVFTSVSKLDGGKTYKRYDVFTK